MNETSTTSLSREDKEAIRAYMISLIALPGIFLAIVAFLLGFFVREVAQQRAYNEAYRDASVFIHELVAEAQASATKIETAEARAAEAETRAREAESRASAAAHTSETLSTSTQETQSEALRILATLKSTTEFQESEDITNAVADSLSKREDFRHAIALAIEKSLSDVQEHIRGLQNDLVKSGTIEYTSRFWRQGQEPRRLVAETEGVCFLTEVRGAFSSRSEEVEVYPDEGYWYLRGRSQLTDRNAQLRARAGCIRLLHPNGNVVMP